ncbi:MAG: TIGR03862 family flavoprotein [Salinivirgaceae bacterium]|nr:TIGR03862 family flavoprotein [Salinivirgaceae bacterium]MDY0280161.1 TIGR03862 family flavoprotein [Salinivirgaceae bacterium]
MKKTVAIIGGGSAALFVAAHLDPHQFLTTIYEKNPTLGRKFLVAGEGGLNITHSEPIGDMVARYRPISFLEKALLEFTNQDLRNWLANIGIPTMVGSSRRVYPVNGIKSSVVLNQILEVLKNRNVVFESNCHWQGWNDNGELIFSNKGNVNPDYTIFSLGGASWSITGSDGKWSDIFSEHGVDTIPFLPANCAYQIAWPTQFIANNEGLPLKNIALSCMDECQKGELVITRFGLEGNAIYALSSVIQSQITSHGKATIYLDLKPTIENSKLLKLYNNSEIKTTDFLKRTLNLSSAQIQLLKSQLTKDEFLHQDLLLSKIKALPITIIGAAPLDEAISTTGGVALHEVTEHFELRKVKNSFCIGEMLDWNAPTGGYLLQACFSMGCFVARHINATAI